MPAARFDIVFRGVRNGFDNALVKAHFAALFKLDSVKVERIFKSTRVTLKNNADERLANIFVARLFAIGVVADKCPIEHLISKAIVLPDAGETSSEASAMHQPVEFLYGEHTRRIPFVFTGKDFDYCKVWLVNILVCLLSVGVLYPWAQVRSLRYFYQHTELDNVAFDYSSNPQKIYLIQFSLIAYCLGLFYAFFHNPFFFLLGLLVLLSVLPFYWFKRSTFQQRHSLYRHLAFRQNANLRDAYVNFLGWPLAILLTAGLAAPYAIFKMQEYWATTKYFGDYPFGFTGSLKPYIALLPPLLIAEAVTFVCFFGGSASAVLVFSVAGFCGLASGICALACGFGEFAMEWCGLQIGLFCCQLGFAQLSQACNKKYLSLYCYFRFLLALGASALSTLQSIALGIFCESAL